MQFHVDITVEHKRLPLLVTIEPYVPSTYHCFKYLLTHGKKGFIRPLLLCKGFVKNLIDHAFGILDVVQYLFEYICGSIS